MSIKQLVDYSQPLVAAATVLGIGGIIVACIGGYTAYGIKVAADTVTVTGSAKESVTADYARLTINLDTTTAIGAQQEGLNRLSKAAEQITAALHEKDLTDIETPAPQVNATYSYPERGAPIQTGYSASRQVIVRSDNIDRLSDIANNVGPLTGPGYNVSIYGIELTYRGLDDLRVKLLSTAIQDAHARAEAIAKDSGRAVGALRTASSGVVQVLPAGGVEISDYGTYDTQSKQKDVMVTVRATFSLR